MRYAIFSALFTPHVGGVEVFTANIAATLAARGDEAVVVTSQLGGSPADETTDGYRVLRVPCKPLMDGRLPLGKHDAQWRAQMDLLASLEVDRVLVNCRFYPHSIDGLEFARAHNLPAVMLEHGSAPLTLSSGPADFAIKQWERRYTKRVKAIGPRCAAISRKSALWLASLGFETDRVIPNAIDAAAYRAQASGRDLRDELGIGADTPLVAFVGRIAPDKGADALAAAAAVPECAGIEFAFAGDGPLRNELDATSSDNVHLLGPLGRGDVASLLLQADLFCLPSRSEGFCTALLEAGACGCMPVITDVGGTDELVSEQTGVILPNAAPQTIAEAIASAAADLDASHAKGAALQALVESEHTWEQTAQALEASFE